MARRLGVMRGCGGPAAGRRSWALICLLVAIVGSGDRPVCGQTTIVDSKTETTHFGWNFSRADDPYFLKFPDGWKRVRAIGYPNYVSGEITARDPKLEQTLLRWDTAVTRHWPAVRALLTGDPIRGPHPWDRHLSWLPGWLPARAAAENLPVLMPSIADNLVDRYLRVELDGGQFAVQSPAIPISRRFQYRFSCQVMTNGLKHDTAIAEFVFLDAAGKVLDSASTTPISGTTDWVTLTTPAMQPPPLATQLLVRLSVLRGDDGLEDIRGIVGFDNVRIDQLPHLAITTNQPLGLYQIGQPVQATAKIMGFSQADSEIQFILFDSTGAKLSERVQAVSIKSPQQEVADDDRDASTAEVIGTAVDWQLPALEPGFYRLVASIREHRVATLASETTFAVIDNIDAGPDQQCFGWTLPSGRQSVPAADLASWLADCGVAWVKYPSWLAPEESGLAEENSLIFSRLAEQGIETIGMLDVPPESQQRLYDLRGRRDLVAAQLFRNRATWQPLLEPIMSRLNLKVRRWQLGAERDFSFLGRPHLNESITQIASGLQGFGQPIDIAISWPWDEVPFQEGKSSWQAECRSSTPPLSAQELDAYLSQRALDRRTESPSTWLLLDPIAADRYDLSTRIQDLVLRMATVRGHRVQAAFVSDPYDRRHGLLRRDGRPDELLLPWRTTAQLIGDLHKSGSLKLQGDTDNLVFTGKDRAVLVLWSPVPSEERLFLGDGAKTIDVWGQVRPLKIELDGNQPVQVVPTGPQPIFVVGADPSLLAFRMSVDIQPRRLDSLIGRKQTLSVSLTNPSPESLVGEVRMVPPESWLIETPARSWKALAGRSTAQPFEVALTNVAMIGTYQVPLQFEIETVPPKRITVYREVTVGPEGIDIQARTRMLAQDELLVQIEMTNRLGTDISFDCLLFPPPGRQFQERGLKLEAGTTVRRDFYWTNANEFLDQEMTLRAVEQDGPRVINYGFRVSR
jgi:hypothetical protein